MNAMKRFLLAVRGIRAPHVQDDDDRRWPWWDEDNEDHESLNFIRCEAALRKHDDLMEAMAKGDAQPKKRFGVITTADVDLKKTGQK